MQPLQLQKWFFQQSWAELETMSMYELMAVKNAFWPNGHPEDEDLPFKGRNLYLALLFQVYRKKALHVWPLPEKKKVETVWT